MSRSWFGPLSVVTVAVFTCWVAVGLVRFKAGSPFEEVFGIQPIRHHVAEDSWAPMEGAFQHLQSGSDERVYTKLFVREQVKFQYPLSSLLVLFVVRDWDVLNLISLAMFAVTGALMVLLMRLLLRQEEARLPLGERLPVSGLERYALPLLMTVTFFPLVWAYRLGQIQTWLIAATVAMVVLWVSGRRAHAGALVGLMVLVKPQYGFLLLWGLLRRQWGFCGAFTAVATIGAGASVATFGWDNHLDYFNVLSQLSRHGEGWYANQSINGLLNRLFETADFSSWFNFFLPAYHPVVYWGTMSTTLLLIGLALFGPVRHRGGTLDLFIALFTCTIASPVAWNHHYGVLLPVYLAMFVWALRRPIWGRRWTLPLLAASYALVGTHHGEAFKFMHGWSNLVQSYMFFGGLLLLACLYRLAAVADPEVTPPAGIEADRLPTATTSRQRDVALVVR